MEEKWWAIGVIGVVCAINLGGVAHEYANGKVKEECYKVVAIAIQNKVEPPKCEKL
jgi:hypothetical protein